MRRISVLLAAAAIVLIVFVGFTYKSRLAAVRAHGVRPTPQIRPSLDAIANRGWKYDKFDPQTNLPVVQITAKAFEAAHEPSAMGLRDVRIKLYDKAGTQYTFVHSESASFDEGSNLMRSQGAVHLVMNVPSDKNADNPADVAKFLQVQTSGVAYNTQSGSAQTDQPASFHFPAGSGSATGVAYDPSTRELRLKSHVALDWIGNGPAANAMHIEAGELLYREREHKIYLSPWSKMVRQGTSIEGKDSVVSLDEDGEL
ncbi:MAG TPA: LPS export ABC transporter periplasmic protein LptC, partial [Rhizomicrobium sp.]|nr:LPS export ABC transporter periplasmic protein LptC [Rhizomicrobium sp.]